jgi:GTP-binding protein
MKPPIVAIVGRQNVGKSTLFNLLAGRRISIVDPQPGVTRDRVSAMVSYQEKFFELVDTGGISLNKSIPFHQEITRQINYAIEEAFLIIFLVDVNSGITPLDSYIAGLLRKKGSDVILAINKVDNQILMEEIGEFFSLGFEEVHPISAIHKRGTERLFERICERLPSISSQKDIPLKIAIIGKRNCGKSTLVNTLVGKERVIVSEKPGTTRDSIDVLISYHGKNFLLIDTAGIRKRSKIADSVELFSRSRTQGTLKRADVVLFMIDITLPLSRVDKNIGMLIQESKKPSVILLNKWDLAKGPPEEYIHYICDQTKVLDYAPIMIISAKTGFNCEKIFEIAETLYLQDGLKISTARLNQVIEYAKRENPPPSKGTKLPKILYATQIGTHPQRFLIFVNRKEIFREDYKRYLLRKLRENLPIGEVPIEIEFKDRPKVIIQKK